MLVIKTLKMRNFFSFGNVPQEIDFTDTDMALILGQNNDISAEGDNEARRNGAGKSAIVHGLVFGLYGKSIDNSIKISNMINNINEKGCEVRVEFSRSGRNYIVERGRSPTYFRFKEVNDSGDEIQDETRGESAVTQEDLTSVIGISQTLFEHIVVQNTTVLPFLTLSAAKQREMIEELLGLTQLTEKANLLKDMAKETKQKAENEKFKNDTLAASNERIIRSIETLQQNANDFEAKRTNRITTIQDELLSFDGFDFDAMLRLALEKEDVLKHNQKRNDLMKQLSTVVIKQERFHESTLENKLKIQQRLETLKVLDVDAELAAHSVNASVQLIAQEVRDANTRISLLEGEKTTYHNKALMARTQISRTLKTIQELQENTCPVCKQDIPCNDEHTERLAKLQEEIKVLEDQEEKANEKYNEIQDKINKIDIPVIPEKVKTFYSTESDAALHQHKVLELQKELDEEVKNPYDADIDDLLKLIDATPEMEVPDMTFSSVDIQTLKHQFSTLCNDLTREENAENPYISQIHTLKENSIQEVDYSEYDHLMKVAEHQDVLCKMLMNKDSYVRKQIIEQSIPFLNSRLQYYIENGGSQHNVQFMNDLGVEILCMGKELDFNQLSRGEKLRVILALNNAFRDTYESLYQSINLVIVDELIDNGMDISGRECAWRILQDMCALRSKNIYVVSHHEELVSKSENVVKVVKENGFSTMTRFKSYDM